jgi:hypothetical protein
MSIARREAKVQQRLLALRGAEQAAGAAQHGAILAARDRRAAARALVGHVEPVGLVPRARSRDARDLGNHVARTAHDDRVALPDVLAADLVLVVQRGVHDRGAADETGFSRATGVSAPVRPTWMSMFSSSVVASSAGNLCATAQRGARETKPSCCLLGEAVDLVDHAVDVVGELRPLLAHLA